MVRWGGKEFVVVQLDTDPDTALANLEKARARVRDEFGAASGPNLTISVGLAHHTEPITEQRFRQLHDAALELKENGSWPPSGAW